MQADPSGTRRLAEWAKSHALLAGFDLAGITSPDPPSHLDVLDAWLSAGRHGEMAYLATERSRQRRADPRAILPECQSILVVAQSVYHGGEHGSARIAEYARGQDYHDVFRDRLEALVRGLRAEVGASFAYRIYVDTGPLLERELAQRAGLGWIGKNTCLINPRVGSFLLLGEILLGLALPPDPPFPADRCGSCTRCVEACPTGCIRSDRTIDARRCISYLTIELKDEIPLDLRAVVGDWLFGCDVCQQVCPWNRFAIPSLDPAFQPRQALIAAAPEHFLQAEGEATWQVLKASPLRRPRRRGLARNAAIVAGNRGDPAAVPALATALTADPEPIVRAHAAWALGRLGTADARGALANALEREVDTQVLAEIRAGLA